LRKLIISLFLCLIVVCPALLRAEGHASWTTGSWQVVVKNGSARFYQQGNEHFSLYPAVQYDKATIIQKDDVIRYETLADESQSVSHVQYHYQNGVVDVEIGFLPKKSKAVLLSIAGELLAGQQVQLDKRLVTVPLRFEKHEFPHAKRMTFWPGESDKQMTVEIDGVNFANLRDYRNQPNRNDLQVFVHTKPGQTAHLRIVLGEQKEQIVNIPQAKPEAKKSHIKRLEKIKTPSWATHDELELTTSGLIQNRLLNPGFEADMSGWGWGITSYQMSDRGRRPWVLDQEVMHSGRQSLRYDVLPLEVPPMAFGMPIVTVPGQVYTVSFYAKSSISGMRTSLFIQTDAWPKFLGKRFELKTGWQRLTYTFTAPNSLARIGLGDPWGVKHRKDQIHGSIWFDDVQLHQGDSPEDFMQCPIQVWSDTSTRDQYIFMKDHEQPVKINVTNTTHDNQKIVIDVSVRDASGVEYMTREFACELPGNTKHIFDLPLAQTSLKGLIRLQMKVKANDFEKTYTGRVGRIEPMANVDQGRFRYGLRHDWLTADDALFYQNLGYRGSLSFFAPKDPNLIDQLVSMDFLHIITTINKRDMQIPQFDHMLYTQEDWDNFSEELDKVLPALQQQPVWKTLNEPNVSGYANSPEACAQAVQIFAKKVKALNPKALILSPDPYNASRDGQSWLDRFFKAGGNRVVDALAIHTYRSRPEDPDLATDIERLVELKSRYGLSDSPIYFTEGEGTCPYNLPLLNASPLRGFYPWRLGPLSLDVGKAERLAAAMMCRTLLACLAHRDQVEFYLDWGEEESPVQAPSLGTPTAKMCAINNLLKLLGKATLHSEKLIGDKSKTYVFTNDDGSVVTAMWLYDLAVDRGESQGKILTMPILPPDWKLLDFMGNPVRFEKQNKKIALTLASHPVYLVSPAGSLDAILNHLDYTQIGGLGAQSVTLQLRRNSQNSGSINVVNRLPQTLEGTLAYRIDKKTWQQQPLSLNARQQIETPISLRMLDSNPLKMSNVEAVFTPEGNRSTVSRIWQQEAMGVTHLSRKISVDGDPTDWAGVKPLHIDGASKVWTWLKQPTWHGTKDLDAKLYMGWKADGLYACIVVQDDFFSQKHDMPNSWQGDSLQLYIDLMGDGADELGTRYDSNDQVIAIALSQGKSQMYRTLPPEWQIGFVDEGPILDGGCAVVRREGLTVYEFYLPAKQLFPLAFKPSTAFGLSIAVNDADADHQRRQALVTTPLPDQPHALPELWPAAVFLPE